MPQVLNEITVYRSPSLAAGGKYMLKSEVRYAVLCYATLCCVFFSSVLCCAVLCPSLSCVLLLYLCSAFAIMLMDVDGFEMFGMASAASVMKSITCQK